MDMTFSSPARKVRIVALIVFCVASSAGNLMAQDQPQEPIQPMRDEEMCQWLREHSTWIESKKGPVRGIGGQAVERIWKRVGSERFLSTLAFALGDPELREVAALVACGDRDQRLVPFVAKALEAMEDDIANPTEAKDWKHGSVRYRMVVYLSYFPDPQSVDALLKVVEKDEYLRLCQSDGPRGHVRIWGENIVWEAAELIYTITGGAIGWTRGQSGRSVPPAKEFHKMAAEWCKWWEANKEKILREHQDATDLIAMTRSRNVEGLRGLLERGATVNSRDMKGMTALHWAVKEQQPQIAKLLIASGADVNAKSKGGHTPLHVASGIGNTNLIEFLIEKRAQVNAKDDTGKTPLDCAEDEVVKTLLTEHGAKPGKELDR